MLLGMLMADFLEELGCDWIGPATNLKDALDSARALARQSRPRAVEQPIEQIILVGADSRRAAKRSDNMRIILDQLGQQLVPDAVAHCAQVVVARVAARFETMRGTVSFDLGASDLEQRADQFEILDFGL